MSLREFAMRVGRAVSGTPERRILAAGLAVRLIPAALVFGAEDVQSWSVLGETLATGGNIYETPHAIVWPPLWIVLTALAHVMASLSPVPFHLAVKSFPIAADLVIAFVLLEHVRRRGGNGPRAAMLYALNPVAIYVSAIHGQFDAIPALCLLLAVVAAAEAPGSIRAGFWAGLGAAFKTWPLFVVPALLSWRQSMRQRIATGGVAVALFSLALLVPALVVGAGPVMETFAYRGFSGWWGVTSLAGLAGADADQLVFSRVFDAAMVVAGIFVLLRGMQPEPGALLLLLTFYVFTPGFGLQYLVWLLPVAILADRRHTVAYSALAAAVIAFEIALRPHAGHFGDTFRILPHPGYARAIGGENDLFWTRLDRLPLWGFCVYWWGRTLWTGVRRNDWNAATL